MPKKTKKEKIIAQYRKKIRLLSFNQENKNNISQNNNNKHSIKKETKEIKQIEKDKDKSFFNKYFLLDLKKSLFLIILIIALEIGLYFAKLIK
ncbi:MAG: hypothetical protein NZM02_03080 [Patescibacteria group bacterium]|nr:hypothetical protein [Patescibacteria group bacterium]